MNKQTDKLQSQQYPCQKQQR